MSNNSIKDETTSASEDLMLFEHRESVPLTTDNATFYRSAGGMVSLKLCSDKNEEVFERVAIIRAFPINAPNEFLSVRVENEKGEEIGMIRRLSDFPAETVELIEAELALRYFTPEIKRIITAKEKFGFHYWDVDTSAGKLSIVLTNPYGNIRTLEDKRVIITDMDGNCFVIPDISKLDKASARRIDVYM